jgi:LysR family transcriptional regulator, low CO2-responsive transcriptional regulator
MTLTQLNAFVLVARLGSVKAAAKALQVSEPAVSQAIASLRQHLGDPLIVRQESGMALTPGGNRLLTLASQMVSLGADAEAAVRAAQGGPEQVRLVATSAMVEFVTAPLIEAFVKRSARTIDVSAGMASGEEMAVLVLNRLADIALGPNLARETSLTSEPIFRCKIVAVASPRTRPTGGPAQWPWLVDPSGTDPTSDTHHLLRKLRVPESKIRVFPNQTAAWSAAADGAGVAPAISHLVLHQVERGELHVVDTPATPLETCWYATTLPAERRSPATSSLRRFLRTPEAMQLLRVPTAGVPPSRFRPPVYVTIWS